MDQEQWLEQPAVDDVDLLEILRALADPGRLRILAVLGDGEFHPCGTASYDLDMHKSTLSHHLKVMREAGITSARVVGRNREVRLRRDLDERFPGLIDSLLAGVGV